MAFVQADLDAIDAAIVSIATTGVEEIHFSDGRSLRYTSVEALLKARAAIQSLVALTSDTTPRVKQVRLVSGGGY